MEDKLKNILILVDSISLVCGVSKHIRILVNELSSTGKYSIFIIAGKINYDKDLSYENVTLIENSNLFHANRSILGFLRSVLFMTISGDISPIWAAISMRSIRPVLSGGE